MELTNNPAEGTGYTPQEAADQIADILDSNGTTEIVDADNEIEESQTVDETDEVESELDADHGEQDETEAEVGDEESEEAETSEPDPSEIVFDLDGEAITRDEARKGYQRHKDYTRKTQELAEQRKAYQLQQFDGSQIREQVSQALNGLMQQVAVEFRGMQEPDWAYLAENEPGEYVREKERWSKREAAVKQLYDAQQEVARKNAEYEQFQRGEAIKNAREELIKRYPIEFGDAKTAKKTLDTVTSYLSENGFSAEEINNTADARIIDLVYRAYKYDQIQNKVPTAVKRIEQKPALTAPGNTRQKASTQSDAYKRDLNRLKTTGSFNDAVSVISRLL
ncbi:hypothetical protein AB3G45_19610 [Shinella sp. S4-D37]|uniref:hypothetical protein n=1 Tax=Shinella sp. S4-D37 TaxID=3161999 RepID=UPI0034655F4B